MSKRIESITDLADIAGAELGTKQSKSSIEKKVEADSPPAPVIYDTSPSTSKPIEVKRVNTVIDEDSGPRNGDTVKGKTVDHLTKQYNAFEVGYVEIYPYARITLDEMRARSNPITNHTRSLKKADLPRLIEEERARTKTCREVYEAGVARGDNNIGYVMASISSERETAQMVAYLAQLEERA